MIHLAESQKFLIGACSVQILGYITNIKLKQ